MISWYRQLEENYPDRVSIRTIGHTQRGRELIAVHITDRTQHNKKQFIYLQCLLHASQLLKFTIIMH